MAVGPDGSLYISTASWKIWRVGPDGIISTFAGGNQSWMDFSGDGGPATSAQLNQPRGLALDGARNVYIADSFDDKIRKVTPGGAISTIAGDGNDCTMPTGGCGDGPTATTAHLSLPEGVAVDGPGNVYIVDGADNKIRKVTPGGAISTIAGDGTQCAMPTGTSVTSCTRAMACSRRITGRCSSKQATI